MTKREYLAYGLLGMPLAMAALPVYIHTPHLYGDELGLGLALTGAILLLTRIVDTLQDPWLGRLADRLQHVSGGWSLLASAATLSLMIAYLGLFNPPLEAGTGLAIWFGLCLVVVYTAHSALNIAYLAWGANVSDDSWVRTRLVAYREAFSIAGVVLASVLPMLFSNWLQTSRPWLIYSGVFALILTGSVWTLFKLAPRPHIGDLTPSGWLQPLRHAPFRKLASLFLLNGLAVALAGTLSLFYIADVLQLEAYSGLFLALYFVSGAASLPLWLKLSQRVGRTRAWALSALMAIAGFIWAVQLGHGDALPYAIVCLLSGLALGADLALPAAIAADIIPPRERGRSAGYFGIWSLINKGVLALAAGLGLPLLAGFGYQPGGTDGLFALALFYAGLPCFIKLITAALLVRWRHSLEVEYAV
ncbi:MAG: MFS transporter [Candidatus Thiodiazotropha sp.]